VHRAYILSVIKSDKAKLDAFYPHLLADVALAAGLLFLTGLADSQSNVLVVMILF
jgi:hypothetical protein